MRFIGRRADPVPAELIERMAVGRAADRATTPGSRCSSRSTTAAGRRSSTQREPLPGETEAEFRAHLYAPDMHDPDLIIRTSGEQRISNYLLWQGAYSELVFRDELWPDFSREAFEQSLDEFAARQRRFGGRLAMPPRARGATAPRQRPLAASRRSGPRGASARTSAPDPRRDPAAVLAIIFIDSAVSPSRCS